MFIVILKFAANKNQAPTHMSDHINWINKGFEDGVFLLTGSVQPNAGGSIIAHKLSREALDERLQQDPFVEHGVVSVEVIDIKPSRTIDSLAHLME